KSKVQSYKNLPLRLTELGTVYRYERSGTLFGLMRVRGLTQDDAHIFCALEQLAQEIKNILKLAFKILKFFEIKDFNLYLSTKPEKYIGQEKLWRKAEKTLVFVLKSLKMPFFIDKGGGAFYGPKIDLKIKDNLKREWQCSTIQLDFNLPERFDLYYIDKKGKKQRPLILHRALLGSLDRFIGILLEYHKGEIPFLFSPEQIWILPIGKKYFSFAKKIKNEILKSYPQLRIKIRDEKETIAKKVREGEIQKIPYLIALGEEELKNNKVRIRERKRGDLGKMRLEEFLNKIKKNLK
ncbi:MAG: aminoacyl--tRNA ligase-related protein, partial [Minisyncoccales bacterium]